MGLQSDITNLDLDLEYLLRGDRDLRGDLDLLLGDLDLRLLGDRERRLGGIGEYLLGDLESEDDLFLVLLGVLDLLGDLELLLADLEDTDLRLLGDGDLLFFGVGDLLLFLFGDGELLLNLVSGERRLLEPRSRDFDLDFVLCLEDFDVRLSFDTEESLSFVYLLLDSAIGFVSAGTAMPALITFGKIDIGFTTPT